MKNFSPSLKEQMKVAMDAPKTAILFPFSPQIYTEDFLAEIPRTILGQ
ncbi:MAG: hypothetical protein LBC87_11780 [Fibromonadaceae bacterium]|nr:hypothetical protein [Fibromonadaceae bacterium]